jgi:hypothetical protein
MILQGWIQRFIILEIDYSIRILPYLAMLRQEEQQLYLSPSFGLENDDGVHYNY